MSRSEHTSHRLGPAMVGILALKLVMNTIARAIYPFLPAIARGLGISLPTAGALVSIRWGAGMGTPIIIGTLGRNRSPTSLMLIGSLVFSIGTLVTAATGVFVGAVVGFILLGISKPLFDIGSQTWISDRVPFHRRARALGIVEISWAGGLLVGSPLFGWLIANHGWKAPFWLIGVITMGGTVILGAKARRQADDTRQIARSVKSRLDRQVWTFLGAIVAMTVAIEMALVVLGEWLEVGFGFTLLALGGVGTILGVSELVAEGGVLAFTDRIGSRRAMQIATGGMVLGFVGMSITADSLVFGVGAFALTLLVFEFGIVSALPLVTELRPDDRPRLLSIFAVASSTGRVLADWTGPALFARGGFSLVAVAGTLVSLVALMLISRGVHQPGSTG